MIPVNLKLSNFTSYGQNPPELNFTKFKLAAISGLNGAGKSSLLDAISWCIWGVSRAGDSSDDLIHSGAEDMQVEFSFELDDHVYKIKRRRVKKSGGSSALELWNNSHNLTEGTIKSTQEKIINTLHLTFETFTNSSYIRQGHADEFTTKGPTDRKRILSDILGLSHYDALEEKAKNRTKDSQITLDLLNYQLLEIEAELTTKEGNEEKLKQAEEKISRVEKQLLEIEVNLKVLRDEKEKLTIINQQRTKLEENIKTNKQELDEILLQGKNRAERIKVLGQQLETLPEIEKQLEELKTLRKKKDEMESQKQKRFEIEKQIANYKADLAIKNQKIEQIKKELSKVEEQLIQLNKEGAKCPTCGQDIGKDHKIKAKNELLENKTDLKKDLKEIDTTKELMEVKKQEDLFKDLPILEDLSKITNQIEQLENLQIQKEKLVGAKSELETEEKTVLELRGFYKNKLITVQALEKEITDFPNLASKLLEINDIVSEKELELSKLRGEEKQARDVFGQVKQLMSRTQQLEKQKIIKIEDKKNLEKEKQIYEELALAFGKKGIQAMIIEAVIPEIEDEANRLLERLTEGRMKVSFQTQRETKTKVANGERGIVETLDIIISDEMGERPYEMYSGGEAFRVNFAIRLAISKLLTHRAGAKLQFLVIDEGFGSQDAPGRARLVEAIDAIKDDFEKILIITHIEELKEEFPIRIEVSKGSAGSTFEVIGI